jgi:hypothetical protein
MLETTKPTTKPEPVLAPPGAGLPRAELIIARGLFHLNRLTWSRARVNARFGAERGRIQDLVRQCGPAEAARRILIKRLPGMEDSSRYWSAWMTLDHLRIIHDGIGGVIQSLASGIVPARPVTTASVKPNPGVTAEVIGAYERSCDNLLSRVAAIPDLRTPLRHVHPWFGALNAAGWHTLAATHLAIHRGQIEGIVRELRAG